MGAARLGSAVASTTAAAKTEFDGVGFTTGIRGTKHLWKHVSLYGSVRHSVVFGDMDLLAQASATAVDEGAGVAAAAVNSGGANSDEELMITEFQLGLQWQHKLKCYPACCFFRVAGEYQFWDLDSQAFVTANAPVQIDVLPGPEATIAEGEARAVAPSFDLFGLSIAAGLTW